MRYLFLFVAALFVQQTAAPAGDAERGKTLFVKDGCYQCHNYEGNGGAAGARIAPNPPPFRGFVSYVRSPKGDMPPYKEKVLPEQDLADIYAYLRSRPRPPAVANTLLADATPNASRVVSGFSRTSGAAASAPIVDNDRVAVWDVTAADPNAPHPAHDSIWISVSRPGEAVLIRKGARGDAASLGGRAIVIDLKDAHVTPLKNNSGYPNAFPRPGQLKKVLETDRVIVWDFAWTPGVATPMHFHDKDVVVVYLADGALKSTMPDGQSTTNEFSVGTVRWNVRDRTHTEVLAKGSGRAVITELK
jgi:cbb3-type cytochrome c oxidase subunit III